MQTQTTIEAYHGTAHTLCGTPLPSLRGTFGTGVYWGDLRCAKEYAHHALYQAQIPTASLLHCVADFDTGEQFDLDTPALPLLMQLFSETAAQAAQRFLSLCDDDGHLGEEIRHAVQALGFDGVLAQYEPDVFEIVWFGQPLPMASMPTPS